MTKSKESAERKRRNIITTILCFAGIILNLLFCRLCEATGIPLYLDTVGTIAASVMGGSLPGVIIGFFTNIFKSFSDSSSLYYGALNVLIALVSSWLAKKGFFRSPIKIVMAVVILSLIGGGLGTMIPWYTDGVSFDSESLSAVLYNTGVLSQQGAQLTANLLIDFADKAITVAIVLIMMKLIPEKAQKLFSFTGWLQTPLSNEESAAAKNTVPHNVAEDEDTHSAQRIPCRRINSSYGHMHTPLQKRPHQGPHQACRKYRTDRRRTDRP